MTVIGMGSQGASVAQIAEQVYIDERISSEAAQYRILDLITHTQKKGLPIKKQEGHFYFDFSSYDGTIYFPKDHTFKGEFFDLYKETSKVSKEIVKGFFAVSSRTASNYLQTWKSLGLLERRTHDYGEYYFNSRQVQEYLQQLTKRARPSFML